MGPAMLPDNAGSIIIVLNSGLYTANNREKNPIYHLDILVPDMWVFNFFKMQS